MIGKMVEYETLEDLCEAIRGTGENFVAVEVGDNSFGEMPNWVVYPKRFYGNGGGMMMASISGAQIIDADDIGQAMMIVDALNEAADAA